MTIYSGFSHEQWWFSIVMLNYQRVMVTQWLSCPNRKPLFSPAALGTRDPGSTASCDVGWWPHKRRMARADWRSFKRCAVLEAEKPTRSEVAGWFLSHHLPSGYVKIAIENDHRNSGDFPIKNMVIFNSYVSHYQRVNDDFLIKSPWFWGDFPASELSIPAICHWNMVDWTTGIPSGNLWPFQQSKSGKNHECIVDRALSRNGIQNFMALKKGNMIFIWDILRDWLGELSE